MWDINCAIIFSYSCPLRPKLVVCADQNDYNKILGEIGAYRVNRKQKIVCSLHFHVRIKAVNIDGADDRGAVILITWSHTRRHYGAILHLCRTPRVIIITDVLAITMIICPTHKCDMLDAP